MSTGRVEFSFDEDSYILDIVNNSEYANRFPLFPWNDVVDTVIFGDRMTSQVKDRYDTVRKVTKKRTDSQTISSEKFFTVIFSFLTLPTRSSVTVYGYTFPH
jgi:hypothetical protein